MIDHPETKSLIDLVKSTKTTREACLDCPLYEQPIVILDTNREHGPGAVDIFFWGLNPGVEEKEQGKPFVGRAGQVLRKALVRIPDNLTWAISNCILCHTRSEAHIPSPKKVLAACRPMMFGIMKRFPASIHVPLGSKAMKAFGIHGPVKQVSGRNFGHNGLSFLDESSRVIPLIHPSAVNRPNKGPKSNREIFDEGFEILLTEAMKTSVEKAG